MTDLGKYSFRIDQLHPGSGAHRLYTCANPDCSNFGAPLTTRAERRSAWATRRPDLTAAELDLIERHGPGAYKLAGADMHHRRMSRVFDHENDPHEWVDQRTVRCLGHTRGGQVCNSAFSLLSEDHLADEIARLGELRTFRERACRRMPRGTDSERAACDEVLARADQAIDAVLKIGEGWFGMRMDACESRGSSKGCTTRDLHTKAAHFALLREMLPEGRIILTTEQEAILPAVLPHVFDEEIRADRFNWLAMSFRKNATKPEILRSVKRYRTERRQFHNDGMYEGRFDEDTDAGMVNRRAFAQDIARSLARQQMPTEWFVQDLNAFLTVLNREVDHRTQYGWEADENHVRGGCPTTCRDEDGIALARGAVVLRDYLRAAERLIDTSGAARLVSLIEMDTQ